MQVKKIDRLNHTRMELGIGIRKTEINILSVPFSAFRFPNSDSLIKAGQSITFETTCFYD